MSGVYMNLRIIFSKSLCNPTPSDQASLVLRSETTDKNTYLHVTEKNKKKEYLLIITIILPFLNH